MALTSFVKRGENTEKFLKNSLSTLSKPADLSNFELAIAVFISSIGNGESSSGNIGGSDNSGKGSL